MGIKGTFSLIVHEPNSVIADSERCRLCDNIYLTMIVTKENFLDDVVFCFKCFEQSHGKKTFNAIMNGIIKPRQKTFENGYVLHEEGYVDEQNKIKMKDDITDSIISQSENFDPNTSRMIKNLHTIVKFKYKDETNGIEKENEERKKLSVKILEFWNKETQIADEAKIQLYCVKRIQELTNNKICPTCIKNELNPNKVMNKQSRLLKGIYICKDCGMKEALAIEESDMMEMELFSEWLAESDKSADQILEFGKRKGFSESAVEAVLKLVEEKRKENPTEQVLEIRKAIKESGMVPNKEPSTKQLLDFAEKLQKIKAKYDIHNSHKKAEKLVSTLKGLEEKIKIINDNDNPELEGKLFELTHRSGIAKKESDQVSISNEPLVFIDEEDNTRAEVLYEARNKEINYLFMVGRTPEDAVVELTLQIPNADLQFNFIVNNAMVENMIKNQELIIIHQEKSLMRIDLHDVYDKLLILQDYVRQVPPKEIDLIKELESKPKFIRKNGITIPIQKYEKQYTDKKPRFRTFEKARQYAREQNLHSRTDWINHTKTSDFPDDIPVTPDSVYRDQGFIDYADFCGFERQVKRESLTKEVIQKILKQLRERWDYYSLYTDGIFTDWFTTQGLFSIKDPIMKTFFTEFISWRHKPEGREAIKYWLETGDYTKEFGKYSLVSKKEETKEEFLDRQFVNGEFYQAAGLVDEEEPMGIEKIMLEAREIVPTINDKRWFDTQVHFTVKLLWQRFFDDEESSWKKILHETQNGNQFHDTILKTIKEEYRQVKEMNYDKDYYTFSYKPTLFQLYTAWVMRKVNGFLNMGSTGSGKTGAAIIATKAVKARHVLVVCPKNIVEQWVRNIKKFYEDSFVSSGKEFHRNFFVDAGNHITKYHVVNYDKFGRKHLAENLIKEIKENDIDFVILDEGQLIKKKEIEDNYESARRKNIEIIINHLRSHNRKLKFIMLSATPIINNIREGVSLLNILTGTKYNIPTYNTIRNASRLYTEFQPFSITYTQKNNITEIGRDNPIIIDAYLPSEMKNDELDKLRWVDLEYYATQYRIPKILEIIRNTVGRTVIYTDYVGYDEKGEPVIVNMLKNAIEKGGYKVGLFIGSNKDGMIRKTGETDSEGNEQVINPFVAGDFDVLIASRPFAIGIDEVQYVCNTLIFNGLVWTWAEFEQIIGRISRTGQSKDHVNIHVIMARFNRIVDGELRQADYDMKIKYYRILHKKEIGDCVRYGTLPDQIKFGDRKKERLKKLIEMIKSKESGIPMKEIKMEDQIDWLESKLEKEIQIQALQKNP